MATEIFDLDDLASIVRQKSGKDQSIRLEDFDMLAFSPGKDYERHEFSLPSESYDPAIRLALLPVVQRMVNLGYPENVFTALYEAVKNAHEHAHNRDPNKKVVIASKITSNDANIVVIDQGGVIDPEFLPFILRHRQPDFKFIDFYAFTGREKERGDANHGVGTSFMHFYFDKISYYKSEQGGLAVHMSISNRTND